MDLSKTYTGHVINYEKKRSFGFIRTTDNHNYFFYLKRKTKEERNQVEESITTDTYTPFEDDEVEFKLRPAFRENKSFEAYDVKFVRNNKRDELVELALKGIPLFGYLKRNLSEEYFVHHLDTKLSIPIKIHRAEIDLQTVYADRIAQTVEFKLHGLEKIEKLTAVLKDRRFPPENYEVYGLLVSKEVIPAIIVSIDPTGYSATILNNTVAGFIRQPLHATEEELATFFRFAIGDTVSVTVQNRKANKEIVILNLAE